MIDSRKKYQLQASVAYPHVGKLVEKYLNENMSNRTYVARQLGVTPSSVKRYFDSASLQLGILWKLSLITNHNFVTELGAQLPIDYTTPKEAELQNQIKALQEKVDGLQKEIVHQQIEIGVYKNIMGK